jgi:hypothetical protein
MKRFLTILVALWLVDVAPVQGETVKAAVLRSQGTQFLGMTIWGDLNAGWSAFGDTPVQIDYTTLAGSGWTVPQLEATGADVLILSNPGFLDYSAADIAAVKAYVEAGHGLIISYGKFRSEDRKLAPLVGLSEGMQMGTGSAIDPLQFELVNPNHPLFARLDHPYVSGVRFSAFPYPGPWQLDGGEVLANQFNATIPAEPGIVARDTGVYRGLYFSHYIEDKSGGSNQQDMQVFYNGLLWAAGLPEPTTGVLAIISTLLLARRRPTR